MDSISILQAQDYIDRGHNVALFVHTGTTGEKDILVRLQALERYKHTLNLKEVDLENFTGAPPPSLALVRFPRLLLIHGGNTSKDLEGFDAIDSWMETQL